MNPQAEQTPAQTPVQTPAQVPNEPKPKLYDPGSYTLVGLFFSLVPVFIMSHYNSKLLANGQDIKKRMKIYMWIYIVIMVVNLLLMFWASYTLVKGMSQNPDVVNTMMTGSALPDSGALQTAQSILNQGGMILLVASIILLILTLKFTNRNEKPQYTALRAAGQVDRKSGVLPSLVGLALTVFLYHYASTILMYLAIKLV